MLDGDCEAFDWISSIFPQKFNLLDPNRNSLRSCLAFERSVEHKIRKKISMYGLDIIPLSYLSIVLIVFTPLSCLSIVSIVP